MVLMEIDISTLRRRLETLVRDRMCPHCGAQPKEVCRHPSGERYPAGHEMRRLGAAGSLKVVLSLENADQNADTADNS